MTLLPLFLLCCPCRPCFFCCCAPPSYGFVKFDLVKNFQQHFETYKDGVGKKCNKKELDRLQVAIKVATEEESKERWQRVAWNHTQKKTKKQSELTLEERYGSKQKGDFKALALTKIRAFVGARLEEAKGSAAGGAVVLDDDSFDGAIKGKGAFVKFLAPW